MKILLINNYHYRKGGADGVYFNTADLLKQYGHDIIYFSTKNENNKDSDTKDFFVNSTDYRNASFTKKITATSSFIYNKDAYKKLLDLIEEKKPDVAHIHLFMGALSSSILMALKKKNVPIIHSVHDYRLICPAYLFINGKNEICEKCKDGFYWHCTLNRCSENSVSQSAVLSLDAYFRKYVVKPVKLIDQFIFVSKFSAGKHLEFNTSYQPKSETLYNFSPHLKTITPESNKGKYFLYFGRISREKGVPTLIKAAAKAGVSLKIAGTGPLLEQLSKDKFDHIDFLGFKSGDALWNLIKNASFIIVPSECYENNPLTIVESYSLGKPVIGARIGGIPELITENKTGYLFNAGDKNDLEKVLLKANALSGDEYKQLSLNARSFAENNFNPDTHYQKLIGIYENVIKYKNTK